MAFSSSVMYVVTSASQVNVSELEKEFSYDEYTIIFINIIFIVIILSCNDI